MEFTSKFIDVHRFISQRMAFFLKKDHDNPILVQDNSCEKYYCQLDNLFVVFGN